MYRSLEKTSGDVYSLTRKQMLLGNNSKIRLLETEELFNEFIFKMKENRIKQLTKLDINQKEVYATVDREFKLGEYEVLRAYTDNLDFVLYLNPENPEWYGPIIGNSESLFLFLEGTRMGRSLNPLLKIILPYDEKYDCLDGIGIFVEEKTIEWLSEMDYGKELEDVRFELAREMNPSPHSIEALETCRNKWQEAYDARNDLEKYLIATGKKKPDYREIIAMMIRAAASYITEDFNYGFSQIKHLPAVDIFVMSGLYGKIKEKLISSQEVKHVNALIDQLKIYMSN